jgi:hypothetical protein
MRWINTIIITIFLFGLLAGNLFAIHSSDEENARIVMESYFSALKSGDTQKILSILTDPLLSTKRDLLEKNTHYSSYLINYYENASMVIKEIIFPKENMSIITTEILFAGDIHSIKSKFILKYESGTWKIAQEISES